MTAIVTSNFRVVNAENFKEDVKDAGTSVYVGIGKPDVWSNTLSDTTDTTPTVPVDALDTLGEAHQNLIGLKLIGVNDISHIVPRHTWTAAVQYVAWDSDDAAIYDKKFYVVTSEFKVYKCIVAGTSGSTIQPTQTLTDPTAESDGFTWKYMYTVSVADAEKFLTTSYLPVKTVSNIDADTGVLYLNDAAAADDLSEADYAQYLNQKASKELGTAAGIERVEVTAGGTYSATPDVIISGDGTGATATATMSGTGSNQTVASIAITAKGTNYTVADITFSSGDAAARAVLAPHTGHGVQPVKELGAFFVALNTQIGGTDNVDLTVGNDFRQVTLIRNPQNGASPFAVATAPTLKSLRGLNFTSGVVVANFAVDEVITGGTTGAKAYVVEIDSSNGYIYYHQNAKTGYKAFNNAETITGGTSSATGALEGDASSHIASESLSGSGDIIFMENRNPINRTATQIEDIKVIIEF
jgi:hypothetical protein|tara:strand:- start:3813 stop:5222 length:1410 start_codon:yes stop_codon:yes gene_type:complete